MGTRSSGRRGSKRIERHEILMERLKAAGTAGVTVIELRKELGVKAKTYVFSALDPQDPVTEEEVTEIRLDPKTGRKKRTKMTRLYYCSAELYADIENRDGQKPKEKKR